jgi:hypothetical protein
LELLLPRWKKEASPGKYFTTISLFSLPFRSPIAESSTAQALLRGSRVSMNLFEEILPRAFLLIDMIKTAKKSKDELAKPRSPATNRVSLELVKPGATTVCVAGSFNEWKPERTPLAPLGNGRWAGDLTVKPGRYEYLFVVDGQWLPDPNAGENVPNPYGGKNSVLVA